MASDEKVGRSFLRDFAIATAATVAGGCILYALTRKSRQEVLVVMGDSVIPLDLNETRNTGILDE